MAEIEHLLRLYPATDVVQSVRSYRSVAELPGGVDLAVIAGLDGALVVDARIRIAAGGQPRPWPSTWR